MESQVAARTEETRGDGGSTPEHSKAGGTREHSGAEGSMGDGGGEGARSRGEAAWAEAVSEPRRLEAEVRDTLTLAMLEDGSPVGLAPQ